MLAATQPIGIFDSGIGGLTVAQAVARQLPQEEIIYFGDTAHLPYGDKSAAVIQARVVKICDFLLKQQCKVILIACHSASAAAYALAKDYVGNQANVMNVIDPVVEYIQAHYHQKKVGLIGTKQTVNSAVYKKSIAVLDDTITLCSLATPLLAPMIEEGFHCNTIVNSVIETYLQNPHLVAIDALILACTHYPLIKKQIQQFYVKPIEVIDSADFAAKALAALLTTHQLKNTQNSAGNMHFYVSDYTVSFEKSAGFFFQDKVKLVHFPL